MQVCLHSLECDEVDWFFTRGEVELKLLLSDVEFGREPPWDGDRAFGLELGTALEQLCVNPVEEPEVFGETGNHTHAQLNQ